MKESTRTVFNGRIISLNLEEHRLPDGRRAKYEIVRHPGGAAVLPLLADGRVVLIRQFRPSVGGMVWELPAGRLEEGESPEDCIARELEEETGYRAADWEKLGEMVTAVGFCDEVLHLFVARDLEPVSLAPEADEYIQVVPMPLEEALEMVVRGEITDGKTQMGLLLYGREMGM